MSHLIEIRDLRKTYAIGDEPVHALDGVSLSIDPGEFVAIMGASGSGKSTMLNILRCLAVPTSGSYLLDGGRTGHTPAQLSGGQQQRVAIARALMNEPPVLFADEPTGNLDTKSSVEIMRLFTELSEEGITIVMVTHEDDIAAYAKRQLLMRDGKLVKDIRR